MNNYIAKLFQIFLVLSIILISTQTINANYSFEENVYISSILKDKGGTPVEVGVVTLNENQSQEFNLEFMYEFEGKMLDSKCTHNVVFENDLKYQKRVYCNIPTQEENGIYTVMIKLSNPTNDEVLYEISETFFYDSKESYASLSFEENDRGTQVTINLRGENITEETAIYHNIPQQVLNNITPQNKDSLIKSSKEFEIIEQNPIISWNVDSRDEEIEYTILNKSVDDTYKKEFNTYPVEDRSITTVVLFSIVVLLIIIFLPLLKKREKVHQN